MSSLLIKYDGEVAQHETSALKAAVIRGLLEGVTDERVNMVTPASSPRSAASMWSSRRQRI